MLVAGRYANIQQQSSGVSFTGAAKSGQQSSLMAPTHTSCRVTAGSGHVCHAYEHLSLSVWLLSLRSSFMLSTKFGL